MRRWRTLKTNTTFDALEGCYCERELPRSKRISLVCFEIKFLSPHLWLQSSIVSLAYPPCPLFLFKRDPIVRKSIASFPPSPFFAKLMYTSPVIHSIPLRLFRTHWLVHLALQRMEASMGRGSFQSRAHPHCTICLKMTMDGVEPTFGGPFGIVCVSRRCISKKMGDPLLRPGDSFTSSSRCACSSRPRAPDAWPLLFR